MLSTTSIVNLVNKYPMLWDKTYSWSAIAALLLVDLDAFGDTIPLCVCFSEVAIAENGRMHVSCLKRKMIVGKSTGFGDPIEEAMIFL